MTHSRETGNPPTLQQVNSATAIFEQARALFESKDYSMTSRDSRLPWALETLGLPDSLNAAVGEVQEREYMGRKKAEENQFLSTWRRY